MLIQGFVSVFSNPLCFVLLFVGVVFGVIFGALPGLTTVAALSMMLPVTYALSQEMGLSILTAIYIGGISGGLISAILLNIPGTPSSIATCFDGHPMAEHGEAGKALGTGIIVSLIGTLFSVAAMILLAPSLASLTIKFGPWEYFAVTLFALTLIAGLCGESMITGLMSAVFGMMVATVGLAPIDSAKRFTFNSIDLSSGFSILTVLVGLYAISEVLEAAITPGQKTKIYDYKIRGLGVKLREIGAQWWNLLRSCLIGLGIGILPGIGGSTANLIAYSVAKNSSKHPEKFGTGIMDGIVATESSNNATIGGAMIPLLTLGIPGDGATAILLGGFMLHGLTPGPLLFMTNGSTVYTIFASMIISSILMALVMFGGMRFFVKILKVPSYILLPVIVVLCAIGAYATNSRVFDIWGLLIFGIIGFAMQKTKIPLPPFILGFILESAFETNLRRGLEYANGNVLEMFSSPIVVVFLLLTMVSIIFSIIKTIKSKKNALCAC
jgi:putative tricarboxylic transport membrane protein